MWAENNRQFVIAGLRDILVHTFWNDHILNVAYNEMTSQKLFLGCLVIVWSLRNQSQSLIDPSSGSASLPWTFVISQDGFQIWKGFKASLTLKSTRNISFRIRVTWYFPVSVSQWHCISINDCSTLNDITYKKFCAHCSW